MMLRRCRAVGMHRSLAPRRPAATFRGVQRHCQCTDAAAAGRVVGLAWDLETTGLHKDAEIVQLAVKCADWDDPEYSSFVRYVMPRGKITRQAEDCHGISLELLRRERAQPLAVVLAELAEWLDLNFGPQRRLVWGGHNVKIFDLPRLRHQCEAAGCEMPRGVDEHPVDTLQLAKACLPSSGPGGHSLGVLVEEATGAPLVGAHDALADAEACAQLWLWLVEQQQADPRSRCFEKHLEHWHTEGPPATLKPARARRAARAPAEALPPGSLLALNGVGPAAEQALAAHGITTVNQLRCTIGAGSRDDAKRWLRERLGGSIHPGAIAKIAASALAIEPTDVTTPPASTEPTPTAVAAAERLGDSLTDPGWRSALSAAEMARPYFAELAQRIAAERDSGVGVYPPEERVFAAFNLTPFQDVSVVILGQDPYHGFGQAHGLCFSVPHGVPPPPSLRNVFTELEASVPGFARPAHGNLEPWAEQGVLLLNTTLTVRASEPNSHAGWGWERFTDAAIRALSAERNGLVFMLWGNAAKKKKGLIDVEKHAVVESAHPSPLSARLWHGCGVFRRCDEALAGQGSAPIDWRLA
eukprot:COSAG04_NODE_463_length_13963_cov_7.207588_7_plen_584_part_00